MPLLIPIPKPNLEALEKALHRIAPFDWAARGLIRLFPLDAASDRNVADAICEY